MQTIRIAQIVTFALCALLVEMACAQGQSRPKKETQPQQQRIEDCKKLAASKKGNERKNFIASCIKVDSGTLTAYSEQDKIKICNAKADQQRLQPNQRDGFVASCSKTIGRPDVVVRSESAAGR